MAKRNNDTFDLECPCCRAKMTVDRELGAVLSHVSPPKAPPLGGSGRHGKTAARTVRQRQSSDASILFV